jgi:hypothetical protein
MKAVLKGAYLYEKAWYDPFLVDLVCEASQVLLNQVA